MKNGAKMAITSLSELASVILGYVAMYPDGVHGYHLGRMLSRSPLGLPTLRLGQLYRILHHLEQSGLLKSRAEASGPRPARYRFATTVLGRSTFLKWLTSLPQGSGPIREQVLNRLRFSHRLPGSALRCLLDEAIRGCQEELENLRRPKGSEDGLCAEGKTLHLLAVEARLAADRRWLDEIRSLVEESIGCAESSTVSTGVDVSGFGGLSWHGPDQRQAFEERLTEALEP